MKKLIVLSVVFALVASAAFAVDLGGTVFGKVTLLQGDSSPGSDITTGGEMGRIRIDGAGEVADGAFGGYIRYQGSDVGVDSAWAWWKPIDQFKLIIGSNSDGQWGKEGVTGWGFNQMPNDSGIAINPGIWCGAYWGSSIYGGAYTFLHNRYMFFEGDQYWGAMLEITPIDILSINIGIPFESAPRGSEVGDMYTSLIAQVNLNLDFGTIAITYDGANRAGMKGFDGNGYGADAGALFAYFGGSFGDLSLDVGFSYHITGESNKALPIGFGVGLKYAGESFGIKFRATAAVAGDDKITWINASLLPYFTISDSLAVFLNAGLGIALDNNDTALGFYVNPYLRVGAEWGPSFYFGFQLYTELADVKATNTPINWAVPISLMVSF